MCCAEYEVEGLSADVHKLEVQDEVEPGGANSVSVVLQEPSLLGGRLLRCDVAPGSSAEDFVAMDDVIYAGEPGEVLRLHRDDHLAGAVLRHPLHQVVRDGPAPSVQNNE